jgi:hypothetical protein
MNYGRIVMAAIAATIVDGLYGFVVYGNLLMSRFAQYPGVFRPADAQSAFMPFLMTGILVAALAAAYIYAKGYEGGSGVAEGARFGAAIGVFAAGYAVIVAYATTNVGAHFTCLLALATIGEWILDGIVIGLVYKRAGV